MVERVDDCIHSPRNRWLLQRHRLGHFTILAVDDVKDLLGWQRIDSFRGWVGLLCEEVFEHAWAALGHPRLAHYRARGFQPQTRALLGRHVFQSAPEDFRTYAFLIA